MRITADQATAVYNRSEQLYTLQQVEQALDTMAEAISAALSELNPVVLCVMNGGMIPVGRLLTRLNFPLWLDYIHATRYREETSGGELIWIKHHNESLKDRTVLIVDDILDEGVTLAAIVEACYEEGASKIYSAVVLEKQHSRSNGFTPDFVGLPVVDKYVFGYGMDYKGYWRNAPGIFALSENQD